VARFKIQEILLKIAKSLEKELEMNGKQTNLKEVQTSGDKITK
jgi:hypothetical protein